MYSKREKFSNYFNLQVFYKNRLTDETNNNIINHIKYFIKLIIYNTSVMTWAPPKGIFNAVTFKSNNKKNTCFIVRSGTIYADIL